ncbi:hypothetical protein TWF506_003105 [Arthrobotrys conoides]|uniref:DUF1770-domain-containing protein n=1 Tax=Arthrobotrys conoides TaxID=74498 RepID=A0AAN8P6Z7_9PEZI
MSDIPFLAVESALTDGHIREGDTPETAIAPSTAADSKTVLTDSEYSAVEAEEDDERELHDELDQEEDDEADEVASISSSVLYSSGHETHRSLRHRPLPPLPDLRFEQSYLASIRHAREEGKYWLIALITVKDQVLFPLIQGTLWNLTLAGWRYWNRGVKFSGEGVGAKVRRWWWGVNGWKYPTKQ